MSTKGKDKVTRQQVDAILAEFRANGVKTKGTTPTAKPSGFGKGYSSTNYAARTSHAFHGDVSGTRVTTGKGGKTEVRLNKGRKVDEIKDPKILEYLRNTEKADREAAALGKPRKEKKSLFNKVVDVLSRGNYASAEAFRRAGTLDDNKFWDFKAGAQGFVAGLTGKKKTRFHEVLKEHGHTGKGWSALGLGLDIAADPTTYVGVGLAGKAATKSKDAVSLLNDAAKVESKVVRRGAPASTVREATHATNIPVEVVKKRHVGKLTPEGKALFDHIKDTRTAGESQAVEKMVKNFKGRTNKYTTVDFRGFSDDALRDIAVKTIREEEKANPGLTAILRSARVHNELGNGFGETFADSLARHADVVAGKQKGTLRVDRRFTERANAESATKLIEPEWFAVHNKTPEDLVKYIMTHEVGHQMAQGMDDATKVALRDAVVKKYGDNWRDALSKYSRREYDWEADNLKGFEELTAEAWAEHRLLGDKARPLANLVASEMKKHAPKVAGTKQTEKILKQLAKDTVASDAHLADQWAEAQIIKKYGALYGEHIPEFEKLAAQKLKKSGITDAKALHEELLAVTGRNLSGKVKKEFQLKIGPTKVGIPLAAEAASKAWRNVASVPGIKQSIDGWNKAFRASAHIPPSLNAIRQTVTGNATYLVTEHAKILQSMFQGTTKAQRKSILTAIRQDAELGNVVRGGVDQYGQPINNLMEHVLDEIHGIDRTRQLNDISVAEINAFLDKTHIISEPLVLKEVKAGANGSAKQVFEKTKYPDIIMDAVKNNPRINDPAHAIFMYSAALNQAIAKRKMWETVAQTHGVPVGDIGKVMSKEHGWAKGTVKGTEEFVFQPEVAQAMQRMEEVFTNSRSVSSFMNHFDQTLRLFKGTVTRYNPSFHSRTLLGEMLLGYMGGMKNLPRSYNKSMRVLKGRSQEFLGNADEAAQFAKDAPRELINASNAMRGARAGGEGIEDGSRTILRNKNFRDMPDVSIDKVWHMFEDLGLKTGYAATDLAKGPTSVVGGTLKKVDDVVSKVTESVEDVGRLAHFIDVLQHSKAKTLQEAAEEAAATVRKYHLDYTNITDFERRVMTRAIPFYKWARLSTPVMAELLFTQPGKALMVPKALKGISDMAGYDTDSFGALPGGPDAVVPEWLRDHGAMPWAEFGGNTNYLDPTAIFPLAGSAEMADTGGVRALNPFFKIASDLTHGSDNFGNQLTGEGGNNADRLHYAAAQLPQTNFAEQMITKRDPGIPRWQTLAQFLANPGNQPNTEKRMRGQAFKDQQAAYHNRKVRKSELGLNKK